MFASCNINLLLIIKKARLRSKLNSSFNESYDYFQYENAPNERKVKDRKP